MRGDAPAMAERILELPRTIAVELVLDRPQRGGTFLDGAVEDVIHVLDVNTDGHRRAAHGLGAAVFHVRELVGEHDQRVADLELGMADLAAGCAHAHALPRAEHGSIEVDRIARAIDGEVRCDFRVALGDRLYVRHGVLLSVSFKGRRAGYTRTFSVASR